MIIPLSASSAARLDASFGRAGKSTRMTIVVFADFGSFVALESIHDMKPLDLL
jgi:hypothetical protein